MSRNAIRLVIVLAVVAIAGIVTTQIYWVRRALAVREVQFYHDVNAALQQSATRLFEITRTTSPVSNPVQPISTNYYLVRLNGPVELAVIDIVLEQEFKKIKLDLPYEYGVYDCAGQCMIGRGDLVPEKASLTSIPAPLRPDTSDEYYFVVLFPSVEAHLFGAMGSWVFSSVVLIIVVFFFGYATFVLFRQRRLAEIQRDFVNNMTHEFKTPLSTISVSSEVLMNPVTATPERVLQYATIIKQESNRLHHQVETILQAAEVERPDVEMRKKPTHIHALLEKIAREFQPRAAGAIQLETNATNDKVNVDPLHMTNVFHNLLDNALRYTNRAPEIHIRTRSEDNKLLIEVSDNGVGIAEAHQKRVFDKFYRIPTGNVHNQKGFGLGLFYVRLIVQKHGGTIVLNSTQHEGSTFTITLPLA